MKFAAKLAEIQEQRRLVQEIQARYRTFANVQFTVKPHMELENGCRCGSDLVTTGYVVSAGVMCLDTEAAQEGTTRGCTEDVLTSAQAEYLVQSVKDVGMLLQLLKET